MLTNPMWWVTTIAGGLAALAGYCAVHLTGTPQVVAGLVSSLVGLVLGLTHPGSTS